MDRNIIVTVVLTAVLTAVLVLVFFKPDSPSPASATAGDNASEGITSQTVVASDQVNQSSPQRQSDTQISMRAETRQNEPQEMSHPLLGSWVFADFSRTTEWYFDRFGTVKIGGASYAYSVDMATDPILITITSPEHGTRYALFGPAGQDRGNFVVGGWNAEAPTSFPSGRMLYRDPNLASRHAVQRMPTAF
jgi:hypothetical protein